MKLWPGSLQSRLMLMIFFALLLANALTFSLLFYERMSSARPLSGSVLPIIILGLIDVHHQ